MLVPCELIGTYMNVRHIQDYTPTFAGLFHRASNDSKTGHNVNTVKCIALNILYLLKMKCIALSILYLLKISKNARTGQIYRVLIETVKYIKN